jgi:hypothetical protein
MPDPTPTPTPAPPAPAPTPPAPQGDPAPGGAPLGENGEKALAAERSRANELDKLVKAQQKQLDDIAAANLSDLEKAQKAAQDAQQVAEQATSQALRYRIAAETGITENVDLILTGADEETMRKQAELWGSRTPDTQPGPRPDLSQGNKGQSPSSDPATQFADFMKQL